MRITDKESGMWIESATIPEADLRATLEYRKTQLSVLKLGVKK